MITRSLSIFLFLTMSSCWIAGKMLEVVYCVLHTWLNVKPHFMFSKCNIKVRRFDLACEWLAFTATQPWRTLIICIFLLDIWCVLREHASIVSHAANCGKLVWDKGTEDHCDMICTYVIFECFSFALLSKLTHTQ